MFNAEEYTISVRKERMDEEIYWVARVEELPDVMEFGETREEAYELALDTITVGQEMCLEDGTAFPAPKTFADVNASGRVTLRLPKSVHANCIAKAEEEGVSLNSYILTCITSYRGVAQNNVQAVDVSNGAFYELLSSAMGKEHTVRRIPRFEYAVESTSSAVVSFRDKSKELPLSCGEVAASFNRVKFQNA